MSKLERIATELKEAAEQFRDYRPEIRIRRNAINDCINGPAAPYAVTDVASLRLESIANSVIQEMNPNVEPPNGVRELPGGSDGPVPSYNNAGRLVHWLAQKDLKEPEEFRQFQVTRHDFQDNKNYKVLPLDNVFFLILRFIRDSIDGMNDSDSPAPTTKQPRRPPLSTSEGIVVGFCDGSLKTNVEIQGELELNDESHSARHVQDLVKGLISNNWLKRPGGPRSKGVTTVDLL